MTVSFIWDLKSPVRPHGDEILVIFREDVGQKGKILAANYLSNGYPLSPREKLYLRRNIAEEVCLSKGVKPFLKHKVRVLP